MAPAASESELSEWYSSIEEPSIEQAFYVFAPSQFSMTPVGAASNRGRFAEGFEWVSPEKEIIRMLVDDFKRVAEVESICAQFLPDEIVIWTILDSYNPDARSSIHQKELEICRALNMFDFDFRVSSADIVSPQELVGNGLFEVYNRSRSSDG